MVRDGMQANQPKVGAEIQSIYSVHVLGKVSFAFVSSADAHLLSYLPNSNILFLTQISIHWR